MRRVEKQIIRVACWGLVSSLAVACTSSGGANSGQPPGGTTITVVAVPTVDQAGLFIAKDMGFFQAAGLNVKIIPTVTNAEALTDWTANKFDIAAGNPVSYVQDQMSGLADLEIVAEGALMQPGSQALYTLPGSPIKTVAQLKGKRIGVNVLSNIGTLLISSLLSEFGVTAEQVRFKAMPFQEMATALEDHTIDAAWLPEPYASMASATIGLHMLVDLDQGAMKNFPVSWYVVTKTWAQQNPQTLQAFLDALSRGQEIADTSRAAIEQAMESLPAPYQVSPNIAAIMSVDSYPLSTAPDVDLNRVQRVADAMSAVYMLPWQIPLNQMLKP